ncbi:MAG: NosD domain-containing protein [Arenimonas sp.]
MKRTPGILTRWLAVLALAFAAVPAAHAETTACTVIVSLPAVLDTPGHYCLESDFTQSLATTAIQVNADGIVLDCNGHRIRNTNSTSGATGIGGYDRKDTIIRNCVVDGFFNDISMLSSADTAGTGNLIEGNTALNARSTAIYVIGSYNRVVRNRVTSVTGNYNGVAYGIFLYSAQSTGVGNAIVDNIISNFRPSPPPGTPCAPSPITFANVRNTEVTGNTVSGIYATTGQYVYAIQSSGATQSVVSGNTVLSAPPLPAPLDGSQSAGIILFGTLEEHAGTACTDNIVGHFNNNLSGCVKNANTEF